ncbi:MAG: ATP-binding protein [Planctomycetota bacterium]|jgi:signal transduction histidine kinase/DNA-binding response OmpR family regulator
MSADTSLKALVLYPDNDDGAELTQRIEEAGFEVTHVFTMDEVVELSRSGEFDLAAVHLELLPEGGESLAPLIDTSPGLYVLVVSPNDRAEEGMNLLGAGASGALPWPYSPTVLRQALGAAVRRIEQGRRESHNLELAELWEVSKALTSGMGFEDLLDKILDSAIRVTGADTGSIMLLEKDGVELTIASAQGIPPEVIKTAKVRVGEGISGWVAENGEPQLLREGNPGFDRFKGMAQRSHIRSSLCMPLKSMVGQVMGTLSLNQEKGERYFSHKDLNLMAIYAAEAGSVIQGAKAMEAITEANEELRRSHERLKSIQAQLVQSGKMAAVGMLASGIAHEFNNLLTGITGMAQLAQHTGKEKHINKALSVAVSNCEKAKGVVKNLLRFSSQFKKVREEVDLGELLDETLSLVAREMEKSDVQVVSNYSSRPRIRVNRGEIQQVVLNLLINARQAMTPKGGNLRIALDTVGDRVCITVADTGEGIPEENLPRIFEPFFSTKSILGGGDAQEGSGLGLSVSYGIVKGHGGTVRVDSKPGKGTTFTIELPLNPPRRKEYTDRREKHSTRITKALKEFPAIGGGPILVVDDEWWIREYLKDTLEEAGMEVLVAENGAGAFEILDEKTPTMMFLDVIMPGMKGTTMVGKILEKMPDMKIVLMTGKLEGLDSIEKELQRGVYAYLRKPFAVQDVFNILERRPEKGERP